jgi:predicted polyphosphate/ATP-dependent NAD kinase
MVYKKDRTQESESPSAVENNRNGSSTVELTPDRIKQAKEKTAKAKARATRRKAKKQTKSGELITIKFNGKKTVFYYSEGLNLADFIAKNNDHNLAILEKKQQQTVLDMVYNEYVQSGNFVEQYKIGKARAKYNREEGKYRVYASMQALLRRVPTSEEALTAFDKDKAKMLQSIAEREEALDRSFKK